MGTLMVLGGLVAVVAVCVAFEVFYCRPQRRKSQARAVLSSAVQAHLESEHWALQAALDCALARPAVHALPERQNPAPWQGDGALGAEAPAREQTEHRQSYAAAVRTTTPPTTAGVNVRGRILARRLVSLQCKACGRDLLPMRRDAILHGCPCCRVPAVRRVG